MMRPFTPQSFMTKGHCPGLVTGDNNVTGCKLMNLNRPAHHETFCPSDAFLKIFQSIITQNVIKVNLQRGLLSR